MADSALVKASLEYKDDPSNPPIAFAFNPTELTVTASASWKNTPAKGKQGPKSEFTGTQPRTISMEILFLDNWAGNKTNVADDSAALTYMTFPTDASVDAQKPSAPLLLFRWGKKLEFAPCHLKQATVKYTMFDESGNPTRATASIVLEELDDDAEGQNPTSGGPGGTRTHVVAEGDSLASIAYREYDDASLWRGLADLNGVDDPMRLRTGQRLIVPVFEQTAARS